MFFLLYLTSILFANSQLESLRSEIKILKQAIVNDDIDRISDFFEFPIIHKELVENFFYGDKIDNINKEYFKDNYKRIFDSNLIDLFKIVNIDSIQDGDSIFELLTDDPLCSRNTISFNINNDTLMINLYFESSGYNSLSDINLEDIYEGDFFCNEHNYIFFFHLVDEKLIFKKFYFAG